MQQLRIDKRLNAEDKRKRNKGKGSKERTTLKLNS